MSDIRAEFEAWYTKAFGYPFNLTIRDGQYINSDAELRWQTWQAATEAARGGEKSGVWQFFQDGGWHVGMNQLNHRENTEAAGYPVRDLYTQPPAPFDQEPFAHCFTDVNGKAKELCSAPTKDDDPRDMRTITPLYKHPPAPVVPEKLTVSQCSTSQYCKGWNDCRDVMIGGHHE